MTLSSPLESASLSRPRKVQKQFSGQNWKNLCSRMLLKWLFCSPVKSRWWMFCLVQSPFSASITKTLGYSNIALRINTCAESLWNLPNFERSTASSKSLSTKPMLWSMLTSSTTTLEGVSVSAMNLARATEQVKLGSQYRVVGFFWGRQLEKSLVKSRRQEYCLADRALQSRHNKHAAGSVRLSFRRNLQYSSAALQHPFLPRMSTNLNKAMKRLLEYLPQATCLLGLSSFTNNPMLYCDEYSQMQMILWMSESASLQFPFSLKNSPMLYRASVWQGFLCRKSNICCTSLEFLMDSYSSWSTSYFLEASIQKAPSFSRNQNFSLMGKQFSRLGISVDFFILWFCRALWYFFSRLFIPSQFSVGCYSLVLRKYFLSSFQQLKRASLMEKITEEDSCYNSVFSPSQTFTWLISSSRYYYYVFGLYFLLFLFFFFLLTQ